jgi:lysozyme family protein
MALTAFQRAVAFVLHREGPPSNDPFDKGGETVHGISRAAWPDLTPWPPTLEQAIDLYRTQYWDRINGDLLPPGIAIVAFDAAVNQGLRTAARMLQRAARVTADGVIGPVTIAAVGANPDGVLERLIAERLMKYTATDNFTRYGRGWLARTAGALIAATKGE